ncbi:copper transporter 5.1 [Malania oleifera]|uniref:copper transporter 5.1 n=1 Tax=Malania oleifera TaxID=397392 RepID=UPI0025AE44DA|nr:copper transporter 5.1 [Malania oleifera]
MMHMTFYWGRKVTLLFDSWKTNSWTSYAFTLLACLVLAAFYQFLEDRRIKFKLLAAGRPPAQSPIEAPLLQRKIAGWGPAKFAGAFLFGINSAIGYLLMLAVMSFNGGVFIAVVAGLAIGYLLYRSGGDDVLVVDNTCGCA